MLSIQTFFFQRKRERSFWECPWKCTSSHEIGMTHKFLNKSRIRDFFFSYTPTLLALATHVAFRQIGKAYFSLEFQETSTRSERRSMGPHPPDSRETPFLAWKRQKRSRPLKRSDIAARLLNKNKKERKKESYRHCLINEDIRGSIYGLNNETAATFPSHRSSLTSWSDRLRCVSQLFHPQRHSTNSTGR